MQRADFFVKFEVPQRQQLASERTSLTLFAPAPSTYPVRGGQASQKQLPPAFLCSGMGGRGLLRAPGPLKNAFGTRGACFTHRISAPYQRRGFPVPNITPVPEKPVFYTECLRNAPRTQKPVLRTARIFRTTGGPLRYRMPQT